MLMDNVDRMREREASLGYRMGTELSAMASFGGERNAPGRLVQLSLEHLTLHVSSSASLKPGQTASVVLGEGEDWRTSLEAEVMGIRKPGPGSPSELSLRFVAPPLDAGRKIVSLLEALRDRGQLVTPEARPVWSETITRADRIGRIFEALAARHCRGVARVEGGLDVELSAVVYDRFDRRMGWRVKGELPSAPFSVQAFGYSSVLHFPVEEVERDGDVWLVPLPREVVRFRHRWLRRAPAQGGCGARFSHPLWPQVQVSRELLDISYEGLSFLTQPDQDLLYPGLTLPELEVGMPGEAPVRLRALVQSVTSTPRGRRCGMSVTPLSEEDAARWQALVEVQMHPATRVAGDWNGGTWNLFERSGYFRLSGKTPQDFRRMQDEFYETQRRLEGRPRLGYRVVRPLPEGGVEATLSVLKPYSGCWLAHQLARHHPRNDGSRGSAREALRDIYLRGYEPAQLDPDVKWFLAYCEANVRWVRFTKFDFAHWYEHTGQACLLSFRFMEGDALREWEMPAGITLGALTDEERALFFAHLEKVRPEAYREALDLVPSRFDMASVQRLWAEAQLTRERDVFVARRDGRPLAVGILETAHPGVNLFHVLDGIRIIPLEDERLPEVQDAMLGLLAGAAGWYRQRGREVFVHYVEATHVEYAERAALADLGEGKIWILSAQLLPDFLEHLCEATTPRSEP